MPIESFGDPKNPGFIITGDGMEVFRLLSLRGALKLETIGMKASRGVNAAQTIRDEFGLKARNKTVLLAEYETLLRARGVLR